MIHPRRLLECVFAACVFAPALASAGVTIEAATPQAPPEWALLQRELLRANAAACEEFFERYFDERGYLFCVPRWGGDDGPDDAIENVNDWPHLHALGAPDRILELYKQAWEGHLRQYTEARTTHVLGTADLVVERVADKGGGDTQQQTEQCAQREVQGDARSDRIQGHDRVIHDFDVAQL